jgi:hypothetical protein
MGRRWRRHGNRHGDYGPTWLVLWYFRPAENVHRNSSLEMALVMQARR